MPSRIASFRGRVGQVRRRGMDWVGSTNTVLITLAATAISGAYIVAPSTVRLEYTDPTLVRVRGRISANGGSAGFGMLGCGIIDWPDTDDVVPGVSDIPNPVLRSDLDWLWHHFIPSSAASQTPNTFEVDSKAMRRLGNTKGVLLVFAVPAGSITYTISYGLRCLLKDG